MKSLPISIILLSILLVLSMIFTTQNLGKLRNAESEIANLKHDLEIEREYSFGCLKEMGLVDAQRARLTNYRNGVKKGYINIPKDEPGPESYYVMSIDWAQEAYHKCVEESL